MWFVYILLCADQSLYTGTTNDVAARFAAHLNGKGAKYTRSHKPVKIVYQEKNE
jgi:putative endonuclease